MYGSNEQVYTDEGHGEYGDSLDDYYHKATEGTDDEDIPGGIGDIVDDYLGSLYHK